MKNTKIFALSILLSAITLCAEGEELVQKSPGLLSTLIQLPVTAASALFNVIASGAGYVLDAGTLVVKGAGLCCTAVGNAGETIAITADEHRVACGIIGLSAVAIVLTQTEAGRALANRVNKAFRAFIGLNDGMRCICNDHRTIAMYLNQ